MKKKAHFHNDANIEIIPSILVQSENDFVDQIRAVQDAVDQIQLDIADGEFVPNATWADPTIVEKEAKHVTVELHLMVNDPLTELKRWKDSKKVRRVLVHFESLEDPKAALEEIAAYGWNIGLVLNPETATSSIENHLPNIQALMFMGVHPGFQGQEFIVATADRIEAFKKKGTHHVVELDGGVNEQSLPLILTSGVDVICPGSAIFGNDNTPSENVKNMHELINKLTKEKPADTV